MKSILWFVFAITLSIILVLGISSCCKTPSKTSLKVVWEIDKKKGRYPKDGSGMVQGDGSAPSDFVFRYNDSITEAEILAIENEIRNDATHFPDFEVEVCSCDPTLRRYKGFPIYKIEKEGEKLIASGSTSESGHTFSDVAGFSPNYISRLTPTKNERSDSTIVKKMYGDLARSTGAEELTIAIFDTGLGSDFNSIFEPKSLGISCSYFTNTDDDETSKHGTLVTALFVKDLGEDKDKVALVPVKVLDKHGKGDLFGLACALRSLKGKKVDIINASLGFYAPKSDLSVNNFLSPFVTETEALFFAAAGNKEGADWTQNIDTSELNFFPACLASDNKVAVTSCIKTATTPFAVCANQNFSSTIVDIGVASGEVADCRFSLDTSYSSFDFISGSGSSFATPIAAARAAKYKLANTSAILTDKVTVLNNISAPETWGQPQVVGDKVIK